MIIKLILEQDGGLILRIHREICGSQHLRLHRLNGHSTTIGSRTKFGILGDLRPGLNSSDFLLSSEMLFRLPETESTGGVDRYTCRTPHFHMHSHCTVQATCVPWLKGPKGSSLSCVPETFTHPRVMFHLAPHSTLNTSTCSLSPTYLTHPFIHCGGQRQDGTSTEFHSSTFLASLLPVAPPLFFFHDGTVRCSTRSVRMELSVARCCLLRTRARFASSRLWNT